MRWRCHGLRTDVVRGELFQLPAPRGARGAEQRGTRFAVVVQADELLALSTVLVAPTSRSAPSRTFRPTIEIGGEPTRVLVEQTTAVAPERLGSSVGRLDASELRELDAALALVFGL
jgi:mRNA interferase MazF